MSHPDDQRVRGGAVDLSCEHRCCQVDCLRAYRNGNLVFVRISLRENFFLSPGRCASSLSTLRQAVRCARADLSNSPTGSSAKRVSSNGGAGRSRGPWYERGGFLT